MSSFRPASSPSRNPSRLLAALAAAAVLGACSEDDPTGPADNALITLSNPKGGETYKAGDTLWFEWKVKPDAMDDFQSVDPLLSPDDGVTWEPLRNSIPPASPSWGRWGYKIPDSLELKSKQTKVNLKGNTKVRARIQSYGATDPKFQATSKAFTVSATP